MAEIFSYIKPLSNLTGIANTNGSFSLFPEQLASLNFNGTTTKKEIKTKVSDIKAGQTVMVSDASYGSNSVFITKVTNLEDIINDDPLQPVTKYYLYHLSDFSMEQPFTYNATYGDSYNGDTELFVIRDDIDNFILGTDGWALTNNGNAIFSNIFARGTIEATSGKIDGILDIGRNEVGQPLVQIGADLFEGLPFESVSEKHSGILLDSNNYLLSYPTIIPLTVSSVVVTNSSIPGYLYFATFTLPLEAGETNTLRVGDFIELSGFTDPKTTALNSTHQVTAVGVNTFTIAVSYNITLSSPVTVNVSVRSFALNKTYTLTSMTISSVADNIDSSTVKIYLDDSDFFSVGSEISLESFSGNLLPLNARLKIIEQGEGYVSVYSSRIPAGTYTSSLGSLVIYSKVQKFKVGDTFNFMSFSSETGSLKLTGTINAHSGNFTNRVYVGQAATTFYVFRKKLAANVATLTTTESHSFSIGDIVSVFDVDETFNGTYTIIAPVTSNTFSYSKTASPVAQTDLLDFGYASSDSSVDGTIKVGVAETGITIEGTGDPLTSAIYSGEGNYKNIDTPFFIDASGRFSIADKLFFEGGNLTVSGTVTASAFAIDQYNYWNTTGNEGDFRVGNADTYMFWNKTGATTGTLEVKGTIKATGGEFTGDVKIATGGNIFLGTSISTGSRIVIGSTNITAYNASGVESFYLPTNGDKPRLTDFNVLNAKVTGDGPNAYIIAGGIDETSTSIVIRGYNTGTLPAAIYNVKGGVKTLFENPVGDLSAGFYMDDDGFFKVGTTTSNAKFNPTANSGAGLFTVTGTINATAGSFGTFDIGTSGVSGINNWEAVVTNKQLTSNQATLTTLFPHLFVAGDTVTISGVGAPFDGQYTINKILTPTTFTYSKTSTNVASSPVNPNGRAVIDKVLISLAAKSDPIVGYPGLYVHNYDDTYPDPIYKSSSGINEYGLWFNNKNSVSATSISQLNNFGMSIELGYGYDNFLLTSASYNSPTSATFTYSSSDHLVVIGQDVTIEGVTGGSYNQSVIVSAVSIVTAGTTYRFTATGTGFTNFAGTGGSFSRTRYGDFTIFGKGETLASIDVSDEINGISTFNLFGGVLKVNSTSGSFGSTPGTVNIKESLFVNYNDEYGVKIIANSSNGVHFVPYYQGIKNSSLFYYDGSNNRWRFQPPVYMNSTLTVAGTATISSNLTVNSTSPHGGLSLRNWTGSSSYGSLATDNMTGTEYILLSNGTNTFISAGTGGSVTIRPSANSVSAELEVLTSGIFVTGNASFTPVTNSISNFVFNTLSGTDILRLNGTSNILAMGGSTRNTYTVEVAGSVGYTGSLVDTSSKLVKKNIEVYEVSENILNIPAVTFQYDETKTQVGDQELNKTMIGLIAEDFIDQGMPEVVEYDTDGITVRGLDYSKITALLIPVIKRQKERIDSLENRLAALES